MSGTALPLQEKMVYRPPYMRVGPLKAESSRTLMVGAGVYFAI
jgi:hypothetical protein